MAPADNAGWTNWHGNKNTTAEVWGHPDLAKEYADLPVDAKATIRATMKQKFCKFEDDGAIPPTKLNSEGRHGSKKIQLWAFKGPGGRVYGAKGTLNGKRAFFATNAAKKKKQKADQNDLDRAITRLADIAKIPGAEL
ncbi:MAG: hypothetical protein EOP09_03065 [Proteobacteria bacterium]|nr:MAG: hypothetical protein EOP09_03065 [Pseudomonadota bacterium]